MLFAYRIRAARAREAMLFGMVHWKLRRDVRVPSVMCKHREMDFCNCGRVN
jgi:hypothetical protein